MPPACSDGTTPTLSNGVECENHFPLQEICMSFNLTAINLFKLCFDFSCDGHAAAVRLGLMGKKVPKNFFTTFTVFHLCQSKSLCRIFNEQCFPVNWSTLICIFTLLQNQGLCLHILGKLSGLGSRKISWRGWTRFAPSIIRLDPIKRGLKKRALSKLRDAAAGWIIYSQNLLILEWNF